MPMNKKKERVATCMVLETASLTGYLGHKAGSEVIGKMPQTFVSLFTPPGHAAAVFRVRASLSGFTAETRSHYKLSEIATECGNLA